MINHLKEENAYTEAYMKHTEDLQKKIYDELVARIDQKLQHCQTKEMDIGTIPAMKKANSILSIAAKGLIFLQQKKFFRCARFGCGTPDLFHPWMVNGKK